MENFAGFPYFPIQFTKYGQVFARAEVDALLAHLADGRTTDLIVLAHGWNNDMVDARSLYTNLLGCLRRVLDRGVVPGASNRQFAVVGALWPSKKFDDKEFIPSGAAGAESPITDSSLEEKIDLLKELIDDPASSTRLDEARDLIVDLDDSPKARAAFVEKVRSALQISEMDDLDGSDSFLTKSPEFVADSLSKPVISLRDTGTAGGATSIGDFGESRPVTGSAAGIREFFSGVKAAARNALNVATYYQMKERAGLVGRTGVASVLTEVRKSRPAIKLHLVGHSFGGRLVSAAASAVQIAADGGRPTSPNSITLLQAAFSHYGFSGDYGSGSPGYFRAVVANHLVTGPILTTHTKNDMAVGLAYPVASLLAGQQANALGDENDKFGGIGRNGAQKTAEAQGMRLLPVGGAYTFTAGRIHNLLADDYIKGHSDICHDEVAYALLTAIAGT